ncbi:MAG: hypothetical protein HY248_03360, partial [Fimbriimonas ginsengisoli]|nr:hypothetical protein [Fimbriimonas ginsengisoli]
SFAGLLEHYLGELAEANRGSTVVEGEGKSAPAPAAEAKPADPIQEIVDSVPDDAANA